MLMKPKYFTFKELTRSETASRLKLDNTPSWDAVQCLYDLVVDVLDPIRVLWGAPIYVTSGYRCKELNAAVKGVDNSYHMAGNGRAAADITAGSVKANRRLFEMIEESEIIFEELICENGGEWLHVAISPSMKRECIAHYCKPKT